MRVIALACLLPQVVLSCLTIEGFHDGKIVLPVTWESGSLRGGGDMYSPVDSGCNRISCGHWLNEGYHGTRIKVRHVENDNGDVDTMTIKSVIQNAHQGGQIQYAFKYGNEPSFANSPGFDLGKINIANNSLEREVYKTFALNPAFNHNLTIQVSFTVNANGEPEEAEPNQISFPSEAEQQDTVTRQYFQCIDVELVGGKDYPDGEFPFGFGPGEETALTPTDGTDDFGDLDKAGSSAFVAITIILCILIAAFLGYAVYMCLTENDEIKPEIEQKTEDFEPLKHPDSLEKPATPPPEESQSQKSSKSAVGHITYADADPLPEELPTPAATGSQGRHFHFRYVNGEE